MKKYYSLVQNSNQADLYIYGDITSYPYLENDVSSYNLIQELNGIKADTINVYISSYGGECKEGLAIYQALKRHSAKITTICDSFCASIASVIFMAGDERIMSNTGLLFIHNAWVETCGDSNKLKKEAEALEKITQASITAYMEHINISEEELKQMLDDETWITPQEAIEKGFITAIVNEKEAEEVSQSVKKSLMEVILNSKSKKDDEDKKKCQDQDDDNKDLDKNDDEDDKEKDDKTDDKEKELVSSFFNAIKD
jgi:ATP-dependent Clp protease protease subunit